MAMIIELTKSQARYLKSIMPDSYTLERNFVRQEKSDSEQIRKKQIAYSTSFLNDQSKCLHLLVKLKRSDNYKALTNKENQLTYAKHFNRDFQHIEEVYRKSKSELINKQEFVLALFWRDMNQMFNKCQLLSSKDAQAHLLELQSQFQKDFHPHEVECQIQSNSMVMNDYQAGKKVNDKIKQVLPPNDKEKSKLFEKLQKLSLSNQYYILQYLGVGINPSKSPEDQTYELNLDTLSSEQYRKIEKFTQKRLNEKKLNKLYKRFRKDKAVSEFDEWSYQSFLTDPDDLLCDK